MIRLAARDVSTTGRSTMGVKLKNLASEDDAIVSVTTYDNMLEDEEKDV